MTDAISIPVETVGLFFVAGMIGQLVNGLESDWLWKFEPEGENIGQKEIRLPIIDLHLVLYIDDIRLNRVDVKLNSEFDVESFTGEFPEKRSISQSYVDYRREFLLFVETRVFLDFLIFYCGINKGKLSSWLFNLQI